MEKLHSLPKQILESEDAKGVQEDYDRLIVEMNQFEKATVEVLLIAPDTQNVVANLGIDTCCKQQQAP